MVARTGSVVFTRLLKEDIELFARCSLSVAPEV